jgi:DNA-binding beta-propeller fold protein YncE
VRGTARHRGLAGAAVAALALLGGGVAAPPAGAEPFRASHGAEGITATLELLSMRPDGEAGGDGGGPVAGEMVLARLSLATTGGEGATPARGLRPAAWAEPVSGGRALSCRERVSGLVQQRFGRRAEIDMNAWQIAYLGDNGAIYVLDPQGGNARTRLLTAVNLTGRAGGWAQNRAREALFVSLPGKGEVVEIDTRRWVERRRVAVGGRPARLALDADGQSLWIGQDGEEGATSEVVLLAHDGERVLARLPAGPGPHAIAAAPGAPGHAVAASPAGAVLLDASSGEGRAQPLPGLGGGFLEVVWPALAGQPLLLDSAEGRVLALQPEDGKVVASWAVAPGAAGLFPDPSGRLLLVPEPGEAQVSVIDLARGAVAHRVALEGRPLAIGFSRTQAYVQSEAGARISLIALPSLTEAATPAVTAIAAGEGGLRRGEALGPMIAIAPGDEAVLIAAPAEGVVHVYREGMAGPAGALRAPRGRPLALAAYDRGLQEVAPGIYETQVVFGTSGRYVLPVMVQGSGFLHCFEADIGGTVTPPPLSARLGLEYVAGEVGRSLPAGQSVPLRLQLRGPAEEPVWREAGDVTARIVQFAGHWQQQVPLRPLGGGLYEAPSMTAPRPGPVNIYVESPSLGLQPGTLPHIQLQAVTP